MRANLIFNPNSGLVNGTEPGELVKALQEAGYEPVYQATASEEELDDLLLDPSGLMVVAGGDGSVRAVATRIVGKNVPMTIIPLGTANNIAKMFKISGSPPEIIKGLREPQRKVMDLGEVWGPWGREYFIEAFGFGLYAEALKKYEPEKGKNLVRSIVTSIQALQEYTPRQYNMWLDEQDISGEYLLVEVLNTNSFGPRIKAAPKADLADGLLEVVRVEKDSLSNFLTYVSALANDRFDDLPSVEVVRGHEMTIQWDEFTVHVDAELPLEKVVPDNRTATVRKASKPRRELEKPNIKVRMLHQALEIWLPRMEG